MKKSNALDKNFNYAIKSTWRKCLQIELLILYEQAEYTPDGLEEFAACFQAYLKDANNNSSELSELIDQFENETNLHISEVKLSGTPIAKAIKTTQAICVQIGAIILWLVGSWHKEDVRQFVYQCWDSFNHYVELTPRISEMEAATGVKTKWK